MPGDSEQPAAQPGSKLVLIVEDEGPIAEALAYIVSDAGYTPIVAPHGRAALALALKQHPALVITDLMMPQMNGADLIRALREDAADDGLKGVPIVLMTAATGRATLVTGADAVLRKPFDITEVERLLLRFLGPPDAT